MPEKNSRTINVREQLKKTRSWFDKLADLVAGWCGSWSFFVLHIIWFAWWLIASRDINELTLIVSLEAILLMAVLLMAQNRQAERDNVRDEADYQADIMAESEIRNVKEMIIEIKKDIDDLKKK